MSRELSCQSMVAQLSDITVSYIYIHTDMCLFLLLYFLILTSFSYVEEMNTAAGDSMTLFSGHIDVKCTRLRQCEYFCRSTT